MIRFDFWFKILVKTSWWWNSNFLWLTHTHHTSVGWMEHFYLAWVKQFQCLVVSSNLIYILYIYSMIGVFIAKIHETLMCVSCVLFWLLRGRNMFCFPVSYFFSQIFRGSFCYLWSVLFFLWSWVGFIFFFLFHIYLDVFCEVFQETWKHFVILWQKGGVNMGS